MPGTELGIISLFCGPGGLDEGFKRVGFVTKLAYDIDNACLATHRRNHPEAKALKADLSTVPVEEIIRDWHSRTDRSPVGVIGGPPCQSFSVSNVHQSESDPRHKLPEHYARILKGLNEVFSLDFFVFENVPGLLTKNHIERFERFVRLFEQAGFRVFQGDLDALAFGVPQMRPRVFVVGLNRKKYPDVDFVFPKGDTTAVKTVADAIKHLPEPTYFARGLTEQDIPYHPNHWCMVPRSPKFSTGQLKPGQVMGRSFRVLDWNRPSYTVAYGNREVHVHPNCHRRLSVYEAMLLQGFPKNYVLEGTLSDQYRLVSEAVSPPVAEALANAIIEQLGYQMVERTGGRVTAAAQGA